MKEQSPGSFGDWREMQVGSGFVRYLVAGKGPPLILIHGLAGSVRWWERNMQFFSLHFEVHALDVLEYGRDVTRSGFALRKAPACIARWMEASGLHQADVIGHSMGGAIAAELAADHPGLVRRLVLVNAAAAFPRTWLPLSADAIIRSAPHFPADLIPLLVQDAVRSGPMVLARSTWDLLTSEIRSKLAEVRVPTLVIWGALDGILPVSTGERIAALIPGSRLEIMERVGHSPMWEDPVEFNRRVLNFLKCE